MKYRTLIVGVNILNKDAYFCRKGKQSKHYYMITESSLSRLCRVAWNQCWKREPTLYTGYVEYWIK